MSDTETEELPVETVIEYIRNAVEEVKETKDYLSYATLLDVHLENPTRFSDDEKCQIMTALIEVLAENIDIVKEIGWDLPSLFLEFFELEYEYDDGLLRGTDAVKLIMRLFDLVAKHGNAKEVFVKSIELLSDLDYSDNETKKRETILDLRFYALLELLSSSLKRINTVYPSKFLSMALSCLLSCFVKYSQNTQHQRFITRKLYMFARDYIPPMKPLDWLEKHGLSQDEANKIDDDENYLQRKLLQSFLTHIAGLAFRAHGLDFSLEIYRQMKLLNAGKVPIIQDKDRDLITSTREVFARIVGLAMSFDIDLSAELDKLKKESVDLMDRSIKIVKDQGNNESENEDDQLIQATVSLCLNDRLSYAFHAQQKDIKMAPAGLLNFCTQYTAEERYHGHSPSHSPVTLREAVAMHIRFLAPALVSSQLLTKGILDSVLYWDWITVARATKEEFSGLNKFEKVLFLQTTLQYACTDTEPEFRFVLFTLLVRFLTNLEEGESYEFIVDTLAMAPLESAKAGVLNILKDFLIRERSVNVNELSEDLEKTGISEKPALPKRHYIELTSDRAEDVYALTRECLDETFADDTIDGGKFKTLLGFLNLLIGVRDRFPQDRLSEIVLETRKKLDLGLSCDDPSTNVEFAGVALDTLSDFIRQKKQ